MLTSQSAIQALQAGQFVIITDDPNRENEGDLIFAAEFVDEKKIHFMWQHCSGIICLALAPIYIDKFNLNPMLPLDKNTSRYTTPFTVSIEAKSGVTTGVSVCDRYKTIKTVIDPASNVNDLVSPGHIFPLAADPGGLKARQGHTEGAVALLEKAKLQPAAVLCELMNEDGTMMRGELLRDFASFHSIPIISIAELIDFC